MTADADIRSLLETRSLALHDKNPDTLLALYVPGALMYELAPPLAYRVDPVHAREGYVAWFATWTGPIVYETRDFDIAMHGDFALATGFVRIAGAKTDGTTNSSWFRQTLALTRTAQGWRIAHQHTSVPFYMDGSFRAAVDLLP